jgi:OFA family oxalate/formate antiporter-like MFS transporter
VSSEVRSNWRLLLSACTGIICSSIVLPYYSIGALVIPITEEFGWQRAEFQMAILFSSGLGALTAPVVGWCIDRYGARRVALPGIFGLSLGFVLASFMDGQLWVLYLAYGTMAILGAGTIPVTWTRAITTNFFRQRGLALGLTLSGTGICAILVPQYAVWVVAEFGWRAAYIGLALMPLLIAGPVVYFGFKPKEGLGLGDDPSEAEPHWGITLSAAFRRGKYWVLLVSIFLVYMAVSGIGPNLIPALTDDGLSTSDAATALSVFGVAIIIGRVVVGYLVDHFWAPGVAALSMCLPLVGCLMLVDAPSFPMAVLASLLIGIAAGAELDLMSFLAARYFGLRHYAKIYAVLYATLAVCSGTAPMLFARIYDVTSSYDIGFVISAVLFALGGLLMLAMGAYPQPDSTDSA